MRVLLLLLPLVLFSGMLSAAVHHDGVYLDAERQREIPYRVHRPEQLDGTCPVIIFSHGLGGSKDNYKYFGEFLADNGFICFHIQHHGSDAEVWKGARGRNAIMSKLVAAVRDPQNSIDRYVDLPYFLDHVEELHKSDPVLKGHLDLQHIGMAGHSFGSRSTIAAAGEKISPLKISYKDKRIRAGILMSPNQSEYISGDAKEWYSDIEIPLFHMTGTNDAGVLPHQKNMTYKDRLKPYQVIAAQHQYLLVLNEADHRTFSGIRLDQGKPNQHDAEHIKLVKTAALAFFKAWLCEDEEAKLFLEQEFKEQCAGHRYEWK